MTKVLLNMMLVLPNVTMEPSNVEKKKKKTTTKCDKRTVLELYNMMMESSNVRKKTKKPPNVTKI